MSDGSISEKYVNEFTKGLIAKGLIVAAGWEGYKLMLNLRLSQSAEIEGRRAFLLERSTSSRRS